MPKKEDKLKMSNLVDEMMFVKAQFIDDKS